MAITIKNAGFILTVVLSTSVVLAQAPGEDMELTPDEVTSSRESVRCISSGAIRATDAIDDQTIVFRLRNGDYFMNVLNSGCFGLERRNQFSYSTPSGRLCSGNMINVVGAFGGHNTAAVGCGLQRFFPITANEAEQLSLDEVDRRGQVQMEEEDPNENDEDQQE